MEGFALKSTAFKDGGPIPKKHSCEGDDVNPFLEIRNAPEGVQSFALVVDDPDATGGVWDHWLVWNIEPKTQYIAEDTIPSGAVQGRNGIGKAKWSGPCPPSGDAPHRYQFRLYALNALLELAAGSTKAELETAMEGHVLATATLMGQYFRK